MCRTNLLSVKPWCCFIRQIRPKYHHIDQSFKYASATMLPKRRFPEITGKDNLTVFSYSGRVKSPEWRRRLRTAVLRQFYIFRHGPIIVYTRLPAGVNYYPICMFPTNSERLIGISDAFPAICLRVSVIFPTCSLYPQQKRAYSALHPQAYTGHARRHLPSAVPWISEGRLL